MDASAAPTRQLVRMRGRSYVAFVFCPTVPIVGWLEEIDATLARSPGFFVGKPVVLDLSAVDLSQIRDRPSRHQPRTTQYPGPRHRGRRRGSRHDEHAASADRRTPLRADADEPRKPEAKPKPTSLLLENPVRSGQSVVFTDGDVTVLGSVGSGAEIVAGGSIHIYGALRGRAMAGVNGNPAARIYCQKIEAELLAIDGYYQTAEDISATLRNRPAQAWLDGEIMRITPLN